eukprot:6148604-Alexandrium_andersonii.AAC.1
MGSARAHSQVADQRAIERLANGACSSGVRAFRRAPPSEGSFQSPPDPLSSSPPSDPCAPCHATQTAGLPVEGPVADPGTVNSTPPPQ